MDSEIDNSLRGNALRRAMSQKVPRTLTPYEWELWYAEHGVPEEHVKAEHTVRMQWRRVKLWFAVPRGQ
jgi:hypothetical protein